MAPPEQRFSAELRRTEDVTRGNTALVGYNPYRKHRATRLDYVLVAVAAIVAAGLVVWALVG